MSSTIRALAVAAEGSPFNYGADGLPTTVGLTFYDMAFELANAPDTVGGEVEWDEDGTAHNGFFADPPEPGTAWSGGVRVKQQRGTLSLQVEVRGFGLGNGTIPDAPSMPLAILWGTVTNVVDTGGAEVAVLTGSVDGKEATVATGTTIAPGELVPALIDGCVRYNRVTAVAVDTTDTLTFGLAWGRQLTAADKLQRGLQFQLRTGLNTGVVGPTCAIRYVTQRGTAIAYGCRANKITIAPSPTGKLLATIELTSEYITSTVTSSVQAVPQAKRLNAASVNLKGSDPLVSDEDVRDATAPASADSRSPNFEFKEGWSLTIDTTLEVIGGKCLTGVSDLEVTGQSVTLTYNTKTVYDGDANDPWDQVCRAIAWGGGPLDDGKSKLNGWGVSIPSAHLTELVNVRVAGQVLGQTRTYKAAAYDGDAPSSTVNVVMFLGGT